MLVTCVRKFVNFKNVTTGSATTSRDWHFTSLYIKSFRLLHLHVNYKFLMWVNVQLNEAVPSLKQGTYFAPYNECILTVF